jgi:hypothetical protein
VIKRCEGSLPALEQETGKENVGNDVAADHVLRGVSKYLVKAVDMAILTRKPDQSTIEIIISQLLD